MPVTGSSLTLLGRYSKIKESEQEKGWHSITEIFALLPRVRTLRPCSQWGDILQGNGLNREVVLGSYPERSMENRGKRWESTLRPG